MPGSDASDAWTDPSGLLLATEAKNLPAGWYAGLMGWEQEGCMPSAAYWDGNGWNEGRAWYHYWPNTFGTEKEAILFALEHDPDW